MKKTKRLFGLFFMVFTLLAGSLSVFANSDIEAKYGITKSQIEESLTSWIQELEALTEEQTEQYKETDEMISTWLEVSEGAGAFVEVLGNKATYEITEEGFIGEVPVKMENKEILAKLNFMASSGGVAVTFAEKGAKGGSAMGLGSILKKAGINTLIGMGTVFCMLIFISLLIWLLGFVPKLFDGKKKETAAEAAPVPVAEQITEREITKTDDKELVAVIAAAIAAATGTSADSFVVRSIRKVRRG